MLNNQDQPPKIGSLFFTYHHYLLYAFLFIVCFIWLIKPLSEYLVSDAAAFIILVYKVLGLNDTTLIDLASGRDIWHPFLYQSILILTGKLFGAELLWMRFIGISFLLINIYLLRKISILIVDNPKDNRTIVFLTISIFLLIPYTLDGAVHIDIDNSVMLPIILLFIYIFGLLQKTNTDSSARALILLSLVLALAFWAKLTTSIAIPFAVGFYYALKKNLRYAITLPMSLLLVSGVIFASTWFLFCTYFGLPFLSIFKKILSLFVAKGNESLIADTRQNLRYLAMTFFWFNPMVIVSWLAITSITVHDIFRQKPINDTFLFISILTFVTGVAYLFIGRVTYGVPKYHYPLTGLIALMLSYRLHPWFSKLTVKQFRWYIFSAFLVSLLYFQLDDPIYLLNYSLKMQVLNELPYHSILINLSFLSLLYILPLGVALWFIVNRKKQVALAAFFVFVMAQMIGFNFHKSMADYQITYAYGYRGAADVYERLPKRGRLSFPEWAIIPPRGSIAGYDLDNTSKITSVEEWQQHVTTRKPDAVIFGPALNTLDQLKNLFLKLKFVSFMKKDYELAIQGDYYLYLRKNN